MTSASSSHSSATTRKFSFISYRKMLINRKIGKTMNTPTSIKPNGIHLHLETAAISLLILCMLVMPLDRLKPDNILLFAAIGMAIISSRAFFRQSIGLCTPLLLLIAGISIPAIFSSHPEKSWVAIRNSIFAFMIGALFLNLAINKSMVFFKATKLAILFILISTTITLAHNPLIIKNAIHSDFTLITNFANENFWGLSIALTTNTAFLIAISTTKRLEKVFFTALFTSLIALLFITNLSRGALASSLATCLALVLYKTIRNSQYKRMIIPFSAASFIVGSALLMILALQSIENFEYFDRISSYRLSLYKPSWAAFTDSPVWGYGARTYSLEAGKALISIQGVAARAPHNILLEALYSLGITGTILWAIGISLFWRHRPSLNTINENDRDFIQSLGHLIFLQILFHGLVDLSIFSHYFLSLLFISGGLILATNQPASITHSRSQAQSH